MEREPVGPSAATCGFASTRCGCGACAPVRDADRRAWPAPYRHTREEPLVRRRDRHGPGRLEQVVGQQVIARQVPVRLSGCCTLAQLPGPHQREVDPGRSNRDSAEHSSADVHVFNRTVAETPPSGPLGTSPVNRGASLQPRLIAGVAASTPARTRRSRLGRAESPLSQMSPGISVGPAPVVGDGTGRGDKGEAVRIHFVSLRSGDLGLPSRLNRLGSINNRRCSSEVTRTRSTCRCSRRPAALLPHRRLMLRKGKGHLGAATGPRLTKDVLVFLACTDASAPGRPGQAHE